MHYYPDTTLPPSESPCESLLCGSAQGQQKREPPKGLQGFGESGELTELCGI